VEVGKSIQICIIVIDCVNGKWLELAQNLSSTSTGNGSRDSSVDTATGYGLDDREVGVRVPVG
jgi:hypothetical protein